MNWKNVGDLLKDAAPMVAAALSGPYAPIVGTAVAGVLGVSHDPGTVVNALLMHPSATDAVTAFENTHDNLLKDFGDYLEKTTQAQTKIDEIKAKGRVCIYILGLPLVNVTY